MFSYAKKMNALCIIIATANGIAAFLLTLYVIGLGLGFSAVFTILLYVLTSTGGLIVVCVNVHGLCQDLQLESDTNADRVNRLAKRVKELEEFRK